ncbi:sulfotransferase domain-containing protein [Geothermobacter hydrogeniphilus]|uniref:Sulfotransferase domain-containing protein n=1 Tax=Geothermobacter hydrogeniphilus TaxID=1969733 RepID=A0A1X0Y0Y2_9BACT|nr:sulfotransferase domain-containing protein [Geothermobacter hydrogeniphilus]ORJ58776.1 hypothetical protein B5V00_11820 [Geothermobacter hydrogeniphilus]
MKAPNFMCIGAAKSGTTTLYDILRQHDDIYLPSYKEPHFFDIDKNYRNGIEYYLEEYYSTLQGERAVGDFTPSYLLFSKCAERIYHTFGEGMKFVIILRNPVDRAYSQYLHAKRDLIEGLSFEVALEREKERLNQFSIQKDDISFIRFSYITGGRYYDLIKPYMQYFRPEQFRIYLFEDDFLHRRDEMVKDICSFIGVKPMDLNLNLKSNAAAQARFPFVKRLLIREGPVRNLLKKLVRSQRMRNRARNYLQRVSDKPMEKKDLDLKLKTMFMEKYFVDDVQKLEMELGRDLSVWHTAVSRFNQ